MYHDRLAYLPAYFACAGISLDIYTHLYISLINLKYTLALKNTILTFKCNLLFAMIKQQLYFDLIQNYILIINYVHFVYTGTGPNLVLMGNIEADLYKGQPLSFGTWIAYGTPQMIICLFLTWYIFFNAQPCKVA